MPLGPRGISLANGLKGQTWTETYNVRGELQDMLERGRSEMDCFVDSLEDIVRERMGWLPPASHANPGESAGGDHQIENSPERPMLSSLSEGVGVQRSLDLSPLNPALEAPLGGQSTPRLPTGPRTNEDRYDQEIAPGAS